MRWWLAGFPALAGCPSTVCCTFDGDLQRTTEDACTEGGGAVVPMPTCGELPTDAHPGTGGTTDTSPTTSPTMPTTRDGLCDRFCAAEQTSCPTDTYCLESCTTSCPRGPSPDDVTCAESAASAGASCAEFDCWGFCS